MFGMLILEEETIRTELDTRVETSAAAINDVIDRNLFERYGDVQAFGLNRAAHDQANWGNVTGGNPLVQSMNGYMTGAGVYKLMLLLDMQGNVVSANTVDAAGKALDTQPLLDPKDNIIVDYDPKSQGFTAFSGYRRNPQVIGKLNLAEKGVAVAQRVVKRESGVLVSTHARKQVDQVGGYHFSQGAYDYPGLGWSALVRIPVDEAYASLNTLP